MILSAAFAWIDEVLAWHKPNTSSHVEQDTQGVISQINLKGYHLPRSKGSHHPPQTKIEKSKKCHPQKLGAKKQCPFSWQFMALVWNVLAHVCQYTIPGILQRNCVLLSTQPWMVIFSHLHAIVLEPSQAPWGPRRRRSLLTLWWPYIPHSMAKGSIFGRMISSTSGKLR